MAVRLRPRAAIHGRELRKRAIDALPRAFPCAADDEPELDPDGEEDPAESGRVDAMPAIGGVQA